MNIKYVGAARDYSGYGEACRHDIAALLDAGINLTAKIPKYTLEIADFGKIGQKVNDVEDKPMVYDIVILHTTPNVYPQYMEQGKYHIARAFWETDRLPRDFAINIQACNEVWTGSEFNKEAMKRSGITKPIYVIPEAIDTEIQEDKIGLYLPKHDNFSESSYTFYSIFEWTERKNPAALLTAFWEEFEKTEGVSLVIKTFLDNFISLDKKIEIDSYIRRLKKKLNLTRYAPVFLYRNMMDRKQVYRLHKTFDCFVSAHRGEGWGIPQMEALLLEKPVISTNCGGIHEYLTNGLNAFLPSYKLVQLVENNRNKQWYTNDQQWADVNIDELRRAMRFVFDNKEEAKKMGIEGSKLVKEKFSTKAVGELMKKRLEEIEI